MGRRPNEVVGHFFQRGEKLGDSSNRYMHTCRRCDQLFPKGRVDSLIAHLLRDCPSLPAEERLWVFQHVQQDSGRQQNTSNDLVGQPADLPSSGPTISHYQSQSALDTLAEVSRHHLDYSSQHRLDDGPNSTVIPSEQALTVEQQLIAELQEFNTPPGPSTVNETDTAVSNLTSTAQKVPQTNIRFATPSTLLASSGLVQTASAANQQLEATQARNVPHQEHNPLLDPNLHNMGRSVQVQSLLETASRVISGQRLPPTGGHNFETSANAPTYGFGVMQKPARKKIRGRFDDSRRKEVAKVRQSGACLRCRMLKKSCSGEVPCRTCKNVETARLWKGTCVRARVADEFTLWSTGLFHLLSSSAISAATDGLEQVELPGSLEVKLHPSHDLCMNFAVKVYSGTSVVPTELVLLSDGEEALSGMVMEYVNSLAELFINAEESLFMRKTLQQAIATARDEDAERTTKSEQSQGQSPSRTCYNLQARLIHNTIELWILTMLLTTPEKYPLQIRYHSTMASQQQSVQTGADAVIQHLIPTEQNHKLVAAQISVAIEARCAKLSKVVMNELERRLLQRQQAHQFATFISSVVLLNCVERMTGFYRSYDTGDQTASDPLTTGDTENATRHWPLETPASALWSQGPPFAELVTMLLRLRTLPPKTGRTPEGDLAVIHKYPLTSVLHSRARPESDEQTKAAASWLDPLQLSVDDLTKTRDGDLPPRSGGAEAWDLRCISKILLPELAG